MTNDDEDQPSVGLDLAAINHEGTRIRRRRRIAGSGAAAAIGLGAFAGVVALRASTPAAPTGGTDLKPISQILARNPPLADPVVISKWPDHWTTVGWAAADGQFCYAAFRTPAAGTFAQSACESIDGDLGAVVGMPLPAMAPMEEVQTHHRPGHTPDLYPFVGLVRGDIARVAFTAYGQTFTADTTSLTTRDGVRTGIFQVWIAPPGGSWNSTDIQSVTAYRPDSTVAAQQGPWVPPTKPSSTPP
jgi:hypothetical protein